MRVESGADCPACGECEGFLILVVLRDFVTWSTQQQFDARGEAVCRHCGAQPSHEEIETMHTAAWEAAPEAVNDLRLNAISDRY